MLRLKGLVALIAYLGYPIKTEQTSHCRSFWTFRRNFGLLRPGGRMLGESAAIHPDRTSLRRSRRPTDGTDEESQVAPLPKAKAGLERQMGE